MLSKVFPAPVTHRPCFPGPCVALPAPVLYPRSEQLAWFIDWALRGLCSIKANWAFNWDLLLYVMTCLLQATVTVNGKFRNSLTDFSGQYFVQMGSHKAATMAGIIWRNKIK